MIISNLCTVSSFSRYDHLWLKISIENCGLTAADEDIVTIDSLYKKSPAPYWMIPSPTPYDLRFSHNTARLAYHSTLWPFKVIQGQWFSCHLKATIRLSISGQYQPMPYLAPFGHITSVTDDKQTTTNKQTTIRSISSTVISVRSAKNMPNCRNTVIFALGRSKWPLLNVDLRNRLLTDRLLA